MTRWRNIAAQTIFIHMAHIMYVTNIYNIFYTLVSIIKKEFIFIIFKTEYDIKRAEDTADVS